jgi:LPPG:FO 2-phospho-L-lactate transferase
VVGWDELVVISNTGDDIDIYGAHVSPDPDLVSFWLADKIDERGWGIDGDTFVVMDALRDLGTDVWFNLGDRDLAWCLERRRMEDEGLRPTEALKRLNEAIGVRASVLPMCDEQLRTWVRTEDGWRDFQQFMIREGAEGAVREVAFGSPAQARVAHPATALPPTNLAPPTAPPETPTSLAQPTTPPETPTSLAQPTTLSTPTSLQGPRIHAASPSPEVLAALSSARLVIIGPSNPVISIWPILSVIGDALEELTVPVVCVSPVVGGEILKGPTAAFLSAYDQPVSAAGVVSFYETVHPSLLDGIVADEMVAGVTSLLGDIAMTNGDARVRVAEQTLAFAESLA